MCAAQEPLPLLTEEELQGWIPSQRFPSDHLSLVFDFSWRQGEPSSAAREGTSQAQAAHCTDSDSRASISEAGNDASGKAGGGASLPGYLGSGLSGMALSAGNTSVGHTSNGGSQVQQQSQVHTAVDSTSQEQAAGEDSIAAGEDSSVAAHGVVLPADAAHVPAAATELQRGQIIALPTDTLYGLAACANSQQVRVPYIPMACQDTCGTAAVHCVRRGTSAPLRQYALSHSGTHQDCYM